MSRAGPVRLSRLSRLRRDPGKAGVGSGVGGGAGGGAAGGADDQAMVRLLREGDEGAFMALVARHHGPMVRLARTYVQSDASAEEVAQEAWLGLLRGIHSFEGRSSVRTWLFRILVNQAKTRGVRERRAASEPLFAPLFEPAVETAVGADRFGPLGSWSTPPLPWPAPPDPAVAAETLAVVSEAISALPPRQRQVMSLRDVHGFTAAEVCDLLELTDANQRVLLHRARARVRGRLEAYFEEVGG